MGFDPIVTPEDMEQLVTFAEADYIERNGSAEGFDKSAYVRQAEAVLSDKPKHIALALLGKRHVGFVRIQEKKDFPASCGLIERMYVLPELRGKGFTVQLFGYAACVIRYEYKTEIALMRPQTDEDRAVVERFLFAPMAGHTGYVSLDLFPPALGLHMLA